jgi:hypothetical protein
MDGLAEGTLVTAYVLTTLSYLIIITRLFLRFFRQEKLTVDDCLMIAAVIFYTVFTATYPGAVGALSSLLRTSADSDIQVKNGTNVSLPDFSTLSLTSRTNNGTYTNGTEVSGGGNPTHLSPEYVARGTNNSSKAPLMDISHHVTVEIGSKWVLTGRPFYLVYLWAMKYCLVNHFPAAEHSRY